MTETVREQLRAVSLPSAAEDADTDIVSAGLVGDISISGDTAHIQLALGAPHSPAETELVEDVRRVITEAG